MTDRCIYSNTSKLQRRDNKQRRWPRLVSRTHCLQYRAERSCACESVRLCETSLLRHSPLPVLC